MATARNKAGADKRTMLVVGVLGAILLILGIGGGVYFYQAPRNAFENLRVAASAGDLATIEEYVDFPSLRASVKNFLIETGSAGVEAQPEASNPIVKQIIRLGKIVANAALDPVVEIAVSPLGISALLDGVAPAATADSGGSAVSQQPIIDSSLESMDVFVVTVFNREANRWVMQLFFVRSSLFNWKLAAIRPL